MPSYTTVNGATIKNVAVGYETYGTLNAARDNVILVAHFFSGNSHAAGKYAASDAAPGYRDVIIGAGKPSGSILLFPDFSGQAMEILGKQGRDVRYEEIPDDGGHLDGVLAVAKVGETIRKFLSE
jgi:homoserine acetyltransferase